MRFHLKNLRYLLLHKYYVFLECRRLGVPLWIAILHDWDKFLPKVWLAYSCFHAATDPAERARLLPAFQQAKMIHQRRNKHHWQFWVFIDDDGEIICLPMPEVYRREMLADWWGAARALNKPDLPGWYSACRAQILLHPETRAWLDDQLGYRAEG